MPDSNGNRSPPSELEKRRANVQTDVPNTIKVTCDPQDTNWQRWFDQGQGMQPVRHDNKVIDLVDGQETFASMADAILTATGNTHYIYMLNWWVELDVELIPGRIPAGGSKSTRLLDLLSNAVSKGVQVRAMFWDQVGTKNNSEVKQINGLTDGAAILDNNTLNLGSHHQKILVVKGEKGLIGFCGGVDFNTDRIQSLGRQAGSPMHDVHCRIEGPATWDLLQIFIQRWTDHPDSPKLDNKKKALRGIGESVPVGSGKMHVQVGRTYGNGTNNRGIENRLGQRFYSFAPNGERTAERIIFHAIRQAQRFIYMEEQYLISIDASRVLAAQLPKIERLIILIAHSSISDLPHVWEMRKAFIDNLKNNPETRNKVIICYRVQAGSKVDPKKVEPTTIHTYVHSKMFIIDDKFAVIGSANCNNRGYTHDSEVVAGIFDESSNSSCTVHFAHELRMRLWAEHLNMKKAEVFDPIGSAHHWLAPPAKSSIAVYNENADRDGFSPVTKAQADPFGG